MPFDDGLRDHIQRSVSGDAAPPKRVSEKVKESEYRVVAADWKETDDLIDQIREAVKDLGLFMIPLPSMEGSDTYAYIISKRGLSNEEIEEIDGYPDEE